MAPSSWNVEWEYIDDELTINFKDSFLKKENPVFFATITLDEKLKCFLVKYSYDFDRTGKNLIEVILDMILPDYPCYRI